MIFHLIKWQNICGTHAATYGLYYKSFTILIYDRNDNGLYYKTTILANLTMIIANLALARSINNNYNCKVCCKLKHTFMIVNYKPKPFIVQATDGKNGSWLIII